MKLRFWIRKNKANQAEKAPLYGYISYCGEKSRDFSSKIITTISGWDSKTQTITDDLVLQQRLSILSSQIQQTYNIMLVNQEDISANEILDRWKALYRPEAKPVLLDFFKLYIAKQRVLVEKKEKAPRTVQNYQTRYNELEKFLNGHTVRINQVDFGFANRLLEHFKIEKGLSHNYAAKNVQMVKQVLTYAVTSGVLKTNPIDKFPLKIVKKKQKTVLSQHELAKLEGHKFAQPRLQEIADLFVFQCHTGLAYSDLYKFDAAKDLFPGPFKRTWIRIDRQKSDTHSSVPLLNKAKGILQKYNYELPKRSNQKYNSYLKEVSDIVGIEKNLTTHVARKTFGTILLNEHDVPLESISAMLGHESIRTTQGQYVEIQERKIGRDMRKVC